MSKITCIKSSNEFTKNLEYKIKCHTKRGMISVTNDLGQTHIVLNSNSSNFVSREYFDKMFTMSKEVENLYTGTMDS